MTMSDGMNPKPEAHEPAALMPHDLLGAWLEVVACDGIGLRPTDYPGIVSRYRGRRDAHRRAAFLQNLLDAAVSRLATTLGIPRNLVDVDANLLPQLDALIERANTDTKFRMLQRIRALAERALEASLADQETDYLVEAVVNRLVTAKVQESAARDYLREFVGPSDSLEALAKAAMLHCKRLEKSALAAKENDQGELNTINAMLEAKGYDTGVAGVTNVLVRAEATRSGNEVVDTVAFLNRQQGPRSASLFDRVKGLWDSFEHEKAQAERARADVVTTLDKYKAVAERIEKVESFLQSQIKMQGRPCTLAEGVEALANRVKDRDNRIADAEASLRNALQSTQGTPPRPPNLEEAIADLIRRWQDTRTDRDTMQARVRGLERINGQVISDVSETLGINMPWELKDAVREIIGALKRLQESQVGRVMMTQDPLLVMHSAELTRVADILRPTPFNATVGSPAEQVQALVNHWRTLDRKLDDAKEEAKIARDLLASVREGSANFVDLKGAVAWVVEEVRALKHVRYAVEANTEAVARIHEALKGPLGSGATLADSVTAIIAAKAAADARSEELGRIVTALDQYNFGTLESPTARVVDLLTEWNTQRDARVDLSNRMTDLTAELKEIDDALAKYDSRAGGTKTQRVQRALEMLSSNTELISTARLMLLEALQNAGPTERAAYSELLMRAGIGQIAAKVRDWFIEMHVELAKVDEALRDGHCGGTTRPEKIRATYKRFDEKLTELRVLQNEGTHAEVIQVKGRLHEALSALATKPERNGLVHLVDLVVEQALDARALLFAALNGQPGQFAETNLVMMAALVRDRLKDTQARSRTWHQAWKARGTRLQLVAKAMASNAADDVLSERALEGTDPA